jgi:hypothetical protein
MIVISKEPRAATEKSSAHGQRFLTAARFEMTNQRELPCQHIGLNSYVLLFTTALRRDGQLGFGGFVAAPQSLVVFGQQVLVALGKVSL